MTSRAMPEGDPPPAAHGQEEQALLSRTPGAEAAPTIQSAPIKARAQPGSALFEGAHPIYKHRQSKKMQGVRHRFRVKFQEHSSCLET